MTEVVVIEESPRRDHTMIILTVIAGLIMVVLVVLAIIAVSQGNQSDDTHAVREASARVDCRGEYRALLDEDVKLRDTLAVWQQSATSESLAHLARTGQFITDQDSINGYAFLSDILAIVRDQAQNQPSLTEAVDNGFSLHGKHYPPCPRVSGG